MAGQYVNRSGKGDRYRDVVSGPGKGDRLTTDISKNTRNNPVGRVYAGPIGPTRPTNAVGKAALSEGPTVNRAGKTDRLTTNITKSPTNPIGRRYAEAIGPTKPTDRSIMGYVNSLKNKKPATTVPVATAPAPAKKQAKQAVKPAKVVTNVKTNYGTKPTSSAAKAKPTGGSMRTTPTRTGGGLQSRAARDAAIGPSRSSYGGGNRSSAGPSRSSAGPSRSGGGGNLGGARGRISEPGGSKK